MCYETTMKWSKVVNVSDAKLVKPKCLAMHQNHDLAVREHDCELPKPVSRLTRCSCCKRHRAPISTGVCWWCEQVLNDSTMRKLPQGMN